jgi:hypothetical protein
LVNGSGSEVECGVFLVGDWESTEAAKPAGDESMSSQAAIEVSQPTLTRLRELAKWAGISEQEALARAVKEYYDRKFWEEANASYEALRADEESWAKLQAERKLWETTLLDGLDRDERWNREGDVSS